VRAGADGDRPTMATLRHRSAGTLGNGAYRGGWPPSTSLICIERFCGAL